MSDRGGSLGAQDLRRGIIFVVVYAVALLATLAPAVRASRIRPAEALRYQ